MQQPDALIAQGLQQDLRDLIVSSRQQVASSINTALTLLYWSIGQRLQQDVLQGERASYGAQVLDVLGAQLAGEFGRGFEAKNLRRMIQFYVAFPDHSIVATLSRQLNWSHVVTLLPLKQELQRQFYARQVVDEQLSVRELRQKISAKAFERTAIASSQGEGLDQALSKANSTPSLVFKDPYFLDFLGLNAAFDERNLEEAILRELEQFILELGRGFAFVERQKRMVIDGEDFYLDLLFYHRRLRCLVAIELKLGRFKAAHKGQMELYLKWLDKYERQEGENAPIGLILCGDSAREQVELLEMHKDGITVAEYWTELPPKAAIEQHLHQALIEARERMAARGILLGNNNE
jgi:predicted nuclease of restriction endonuclease-like (RecB) superfamily